MPTGLVWHERYAWHDLGAGGGPLRAGGWLEPGEPHAEHPAAKRRLRNLLDVSGLLGQLVAVPAREATEDELLRFHTAEYVALVRELSEGDGGSVGFDAWVPLGSGEIARLAAGGTIAAVDAVLDGAVDNCYALVRPPGHHALAGEGMGFCVFNNVVLGALHARQAWGLSRIAILDWDVHHGNGAQSAFYADGSVLTISIHQDDAFPPGSGAADETGERAGRGCNINVALPAGSGSGAYRDAFARVVLPGLRDFGPELILIASGFDANGMDPLGRQLLFSGAYRELTRSVLEVAAQTCGGRVVATHEGGYSAAVVPFCGLAVIEELSGRRTEVVDPFEPLLARAAAQDLHPHQAAAVDHTIAAHGGQIGSLSPARPAPR